MRIPTATLLADCSLLAYANPGHSYSRWKTTLRSELAHRDTVLLDTIDRDDVQGFVAAHYGTRITAIRGTDSFSDGLTNMFASRCPAKSLGDGVLCHKRFYRDALTFRASSSVTIDYNDGMPDVFTGHSRGGAIAAILAMLIKRARPSDIPNPILVTHAMPRAGNSKFATALKESLPHIRWQRAGDIVPLVPVPPWFYHDSAPEFFDADERLRPDVGLLTRMAAYPSAVAANVGWKRIAAINNHSMLDMRRLIAAEESQLGDNLLVELLT